MIKRTSKNYIEKILSQNPNWKILDIGCGYGANKYANVVCDIQDLSAVYTDKKFIQLKDKVLPFQDLEFDFVIASHVMEHVEDIKTFVNELQRISSKGYIEVPTKLEDNLVFENKKDHIWHMDFDDVENKLLISKKVQYFNPVLTVSIIKKLNTLFRKSLVIELLWEKEINFTLDKSENLNEKKISLLTLFRKFISKKIRNLIR
ncbi:class I SAM-dependent methyltransferase [Candidatus Pelagibacter sp.]|nr:class I SAM-dependent methyltransferase [Candidatus Pelagibacter sp.]